MIVKDAVSKAVFCTEKMGKVDLLAGEHLFAGLNSFEPAQKHQLHTHPGQDKLYFVLAGDGEVQVGKKQAHISSGDLVIASAGEKHSLCNSGSERLVVMVVMGPPPGASTEKLKGDRS